MPSTETKIPQQHKTSNIHTPTFTQNTHTQHTQELGIAIINQINVFLLGHTPSLRPQVKTNELSELVQESMENVRVHALSLLSLLSRVKDFLGL